MLLKTLRFLEWIFYSIGSWFEDWADSIDAELLDALRRETVAYQTRRVLTDSNTDSVCPICNIPDSEHETLLQCPVLLSSDVDKLQDQLRITKDLLAIREEQLHEMIYQTDDNSAKAPDGRRNESER